MRIPRAVWAIWENLANGGVVSEGLSWYLRRISITLQDAWVAVPPRRHDIAAAFLPRAIPPFPGLIMKNFGCSFSRPAPSSSIVWVAVLFCGFAGLSFTQQATAETPSIPRLRLALAVEQCTQAMGRTDEGQAWCEELHLPALSQAFRAGKMLDRESIVWIMRRVEESSTPDSPREVVALRRALRSWLQSTGEDLEDVEEARQEEQLPEAESTSSGEQPDNDVPDPPSPPESESNDSTNVEVTDELARRALAARDQIKPVSPEELRRARSLLGQSTRRLGSYLDRQGQNGQAWKDYFLWSDLQAQLGENQPDLRTLFRVWQRFVGREAGLENPKVFETAKRLRQFINLADASAISDYQSQVSRELENLAQGLQRLAEQPSAAASEMVGERLGWLSGTGSFDQLVRAVRKRYARPNFFAQISEDLLKAGVQEDVQRREPVHDVILGTRISGTGTTRGDLSLDLVPHDAAAHVDLVLKGSTRTSTVGRNGPAVIYSSGTTNFDARKRLVVDDEGVSSRPARTAATTRSHTQGVGSTRRGVIGRIVERQASKRVAQNRGRADRIAADHAETRISRRMDRESQDRLQDANESFHERFRDPLVRRHEFPEFLRFRTTDRHVHIQSTQANSRQLGAWSPPPRMSGNPSAAVRIHQSWANNLANALLAGETLTEEEVREEVREMKGEFPDVLQSDPDEVPWQILFASDDPLHFTFADDQVKVTLRGREFGTGENVVRSMDISASYRLEISDGKLTATRIGDLEVVPARFARGGSQRIRTAELAQITKLQNRFQKVFKPEFVVDTMTLPGRWEAAGPLRFSQTLVEDGWLLMAWQR